MKTISFEISDEAFDLLIKIGEAGCAEYRDHEHNTVDEFKTSSDFLVHGRTLEWFLSRNFNGSYYILEELLTYNLVDNDNDSWHLTYQLTTFGKDIYKRHLNEVNK